MGAKVTNPMSVNSEPENFANPIRAHLCNLDKKAGDIVELAVTMREVANRAIRINTVDMPDQTLSLQFNALLSVCNAQLIKATELNSAILKRLAWLNSQKGVNNAE